VICKICHHLTSPLFKTKVLSKYDVQYYKCPFCDFIQTEKPFWLEEAYSRAITELDIGLVNRNINFSDTIANIISHHFRQNRTFLDYAGGYGLFVRIMRDKGYKFFRQDKYCENIFAKFHDITDLDNFDKFEVVTALEFFEHLEDPLSEIKKMLSLTDNIIFSTELQPEQNIKNEKDWWYFVPETGQHIAFYSSKTLVYIAKIFRLKFFSNGYLHLFTHINFESDPFKIIDSSNVSSLPSLLAKDFNIAKSNIKAPKSQFKINTHNHQSQNNYAYKIFIEANKIRRKHSTSFTKLQNTISTLKTTQKDLKETKTTLNRIYQSRAWKLFVLFYKIRDTLLSKISSKKL
jgi:hypothetical protein